MSKPRILAFAGSARKESYNARLVRIAAEGVDSGCLRMMLTPSQRKQE